MNAFFAGSALEARKRVVAPAAARRDRVVGGL